MIAQHLSRMSMIFLRKILVPAIRISKAFFQASTGAVWRVPLSPCSTLKTGKSLSLAKVSTRWPGPTVGRWSDPALPARLVLQQTRCGSDDRMKLCKLLALQVNGVQSALICRRYKSMSDGEEHISYVVKDRGKLMVSALQSPRFNGLWSRVCWRAV